MITGAQACDAEDEPPLAASQHGAGRYGQSRLKARRVIATVVPDVRQAACSRRYGVERGLWARIGTGSRRLPGKSRAKAAA